MGQFQLDIRQGHLRVLPLMDEHASSAMELMASLPEHYLRTLDALHLAIVQNSGLEVIVTADRIMAAAEGLGFG